ncbi:hypothetical protein EMIHUDRAFT_211688 [Emiliania huxleyi CCMP1516]|uniref:Uncharacterized protein n=2 Tax=Emiliania huxleyi TaxID=2903 RepID=A0A0D3ISS2_EMIH1|nr:hypothetical protein EMIHUDRAFT_211688 [Emiliania huxleyi CCMP1516]EOD14307.1 hypothetical protein EMIHUDRAFT_211688 [Emiliania huxleyi CCMP1516]|eukprot:XP_005766736.1 hypothetical protein EMIHUDRAFT_211688 [Emiliania huxleyi CCMP1516]
MHLEQPAWRHPPDPQRRSCCSSFGPADCWQTCTFFPRLCCGLCCAYVEGQRDN